LARAGRLVWDRHLDESRVERWAKVELEKMLAIEQTEALHQLISAELSIKH
jgi:hypothetical protein